MIIKVFYQGQEIEVKVSKETIYEIYRKQEYDFHVEDVLEHLQDYLNTNGMEEKEVSKCVKNLRRNKKKMNKSVELYKKYKENDIVHEARKESLDRALLDVIIDIKNKSN